MQRFLIITIIECRFMKVKNISKHAELLLRFNLFNSFKKSQILKTLHIKNHWPPKVFSVVLFI